MTSAPESLQDDQAHRMHRYLLTMGIRTTSFLVAVVTASMGAPWWVWGTLAVLAIVLPYVAVVMANAVQAPAPGRMQDATRHIPHDHHLRR